MLVTSDPGVAHSWLRTTYPGYLPEETNSRRNFLFQAEHEQAGRKRRLHHDQRREQQRDQLQRPAEDRQPRAEQPACAAQQAPGEREAQMLAVRRLLGVHRLQRDP